MSETPPNFDPKAQAAADKAYAKAQRPWYKKKRWIISLAVVAIIVISAMASSGADKGSQKNEASDAPTAATTNSQKETSASDETPAATAPAKAKGAITWGNWEVVGKLQVTKEDFTGDFAVVTRVRNTGGDPDEGLFTVTILKGDNVLGTANCFTSTVQPGAIGTAQCSSTDKFKPGYTEVTIEDTF